MFRKSIRLDDSQIRKLQDLSAFDGKDPLIHITSAINEYLDKKNSEINSASEKEIHAEIRDKSRDPKIRGAMWVSGIVDKYEFSALILSEPSKSGIEKGKVSKLSILDPAIQKSTNSFINSCIVNYDRGWDIRPSKMAEPYYNKVKYLVEKIV